MWVPGPIRVPLADVLRHMRDTNIAEQAGPLVGARAQAVADLQRAGDDVKTAVSEVEDAEGAVATITANAPDEPAGGRHLTQPWVLLLVIPILAFVEAKLTAPSLRAALETTSKTATLIAAGIALLGVLAAEFGGAALAALVAGRRRAARVVLAALACCTFVLLAIGMVSLAGSREQNLEYLNHLKAQAATTTDGFGGGATQAKASPAGPEPTPSLGFVAPLTLAGLLAACGLSMRVSLAGPTRKWEAEKADAEHDLAHRRDRLDEARDAGAEATARARRERPPDRRRRGARGGRPRQRDRPPADRVLARLPRARHAAGGAAARRA